MSIGAIRDVRVSVAVEADRREPQEPLDQRAHGERDQHQLWSSSPASQFGVRLAAGPRFGVGGAFERFVRLPYSQDADAMTAAIHGIAEAFTAVQAGRRADTPPAALA